MQEDIITPDSQPQGDDGADNQSQALSLEVINQTLGKDFKDVDTALKALKDTTSYVGKVGKYRSVLEAIEASHGGEKGAVEALKSLTSQGQSIDTSKYVSTEQYQRDMFYSQRPELAPYKDILDGLVKSTGKDLAEAAQTESFAKLIEKAQAYEKAEGTKSVLQSNSRLGQVTDQMQKARELSKSGNQTAANDAAVKAVLESIS